MLAAYAGLYVLLALIQYSYRGRETWNMRVTPVLLWAFFGVLLLAVSTSYLYQSGLWRRTETFPAVFNVMLWFTGISGSLLLQATFFYALGEAVLNKYEFDSPLDKSVISIGAGMAVAVAAMFVLGVAHLLYTVVAWLGVIGVFVWRRRTVGDFWRQLLTHEIFIRTKVFSPVNFLFLLLTLALALNFHDLVRPIPIGWDDTGVYLNYPNLMAHYHRLISVGYSNYLLIITLPFLLFDNVTLAISASFFGSFLGVLAAMALARRFFSLGIGFLGSTVIYLTPMIMFQSALDMKSDPTLFYFVVLAVFSLFEWMKRAGYIGVDARGGSESGLEGGSELRWLALTGIFAGFCVGVKLAVLSMIFAMAVMIVLFYLGRSGALAVFLLLFYVTWKFNQLKLGGSLPESLLLTLTTTSLALGVALGLFALVRHKSKILNFAKHLGVFACFFSIALAPWAFVNAVVPNNAALHTMLYGSSDKLVLDLKKVGVDSTQCGQTGDIEERGRYIGNEKGFDKFLSLPWKATMNTTTRGFLVDIGFLWLALLPAFIGTAIWRRGETITAWACALAWLSFWIYWALRISLNPAASLNSETLTVGFVFDYGLMFTFILISCGYAVTKLRNRLLTANVVLAVVACFFWALVSDGIIWYGLAGFLPLVIILGYLIFNAPPFLRATGWIFVLLALASQVALRGVLFGNLALAQYAYGITNYSETLENANANYGPIANTINNNPESASDKNYVYRIGTFITYYIQENDRRVFSDNQLDFFSCLSHGQNDEEAYRRLKALGFSYIVYDTETTTIEKDQNGSLHQKAGAFTEWVNRISLRGMAKIIVLKDRIAFIELY